MKTSFVPRIVGVFLLAALAAVPGWAGAGREKQGAGKTELQFWTWRVEDVDAYNELLKVFEAENPDIHVVQTAHRNTEYNTVLTAALSGGSGPDVFMSRSYGELESHAQSGYLAELDSIVPELKSFSDDARRGATSIEDGKIYGVPFASQTLYVYYNTDIYKQLGLNIPKTWTQFLANLETIKKAGITPIGCGGKDAWILEVLMGVVAPNFYGASTFYNRLTNGETNFQDPAFVAAINRLNELKPYMPELFMGVSYDDARALFINEQAAHFLGGSYEGSYFAAQNPELNYSIYAPPALNADDPNYVSVYMDGSFSINAASKNKEAAAKLTRFFAGKTTGDFFIKTLQQVSAVPGVDTSSNPFIAKTIELQKYSTPWVLRVGFRYQQPTGSSLMQAGLQGLFGGTLSAEEVCKQLQDGVATYYAPFRK
jgi:raffinose/stachyose/melibiose transport system substrate-binding protein